MGYTETMTQKIGVLDVLNYGTVTNASVSSAMYIDMSKCKRAWYQIIVPSLGSAGTLDGRLQACALTNFGTVTNITGTNLTQLTTSSTPSNNAILTVEVRADEVTNLGNTLRYVRLNLTGGGNAITVAAIGNGTDSEQGPLSASNLNATYLGQQVVCTI